MMTFDRVSLQRNLSEVNETMDEIDLGQTEVMDNMGQTEVMTSATNCTNCSSVSPDGKMVYTDTSSPDAFMYILVVLTFYALAMTILMVKYIRRENQEAQLSYYFQEFINRDKFNTPQYRNKQRLQAIRKTLTRFYQSMRLTDAERDNSGLQEVVLDRHHRRRRKSSSGSSYFCPDSGLGSEKMGRGDTSDLGSSPDGSDVEKCQSDDELLTPGGSSETLPRPDFSHDHADSDNEAKPLQQLNMKESAV